MTLAEYIIQVMVIYLHRLQNHKPMHIGPNKFIKILYLALYMVSNMTAKSSMEIL